MLPAYYCVYTHWFWPSCNYHVNTKFIPAYVIRITHNKTSGIKVWKERKKSRGEWGFESDGWNRTKKKLFWEMSLMRPMRGFLFGGVSFLPPLDTLTPFFSLTPDKFGFFVSKKGCFVVFFTPFPPSSWSRPFFSSLFHSFLCCTTLNDSGKKIEKETTPSNFCCSFFFPKIKNSFHEIGSR